jgi:hypothetical protein
VTPSDLSISSTSLHSLCIRRTHSTGYILSTESTQHTSVRARKRARATIRILLAVMSEVLFTCSRARVAVEQFASQTSLLREFDVLENIALCDNLGAGISFECVLRVGVEIVVHGVEQGVAADLGGAARGVVDVVLLEGHEVVGTGQVDAPVVVAVAGGGPAGCAVDVAVGDGDAVGGRVAEDDVLACDEVGGYVVDPDEVAWEGVLVYDVM